MVEKPEILVFVVFNGLLNLCNIPERGSHRHKEQYDCQYPCFRSYLGVGIVSHVPAIIYKLKTTGPDTEDGVGCCDDQAFLQQLDPRFTRILVVRAFNVPEKNTLDASPIVGARE